MPLASVSAASAAGRFFRCQHCRSGILFRGPDVVKVAAASFLTIPEYIICLLLLLRIAFSIAELQMTPDTGRCCSRHAAFESPVRPCTLLQHLASCTYTRGACLLCVVFLHVFYTAIHGHQQEQACANASLTRASGRPNNGACAGRRGRPHEHDH